MLVFGTDISEYKEISVLNESHHIYVVQHIHTHTVCLKKIITVYDINVYTQLYEHPVKGIPKIFSLHEDNGTLTVIEEFISGKTLQDVLEMDGLLPEKTVIDYICQVCDILTQLHRQSPSIIHRDIKPSNIMLADDGRVVLIDLNAARTYKPDKKQDTQFLGTEGFAPPEQVGYGQTVPQTDIYALGVTMNILLTGDIPSNEISTGVLRPIIEKCTKNDPENRYSSTEYLKKSIIRAGKRKLKNSSNPIRLISVTVIVSLLILIAAICFFLIRQQNLIHIPIIGSMISGGEKQGTGYYPVGVYTGNDLEVLVIDDDGLAYYYCISPEFTELECPWRLENDRLIIEFSRMHCTVYADLKKDDNRELILRSDSKNWNTEVFSKIDLAPSDYIGRTVELHNPNAALNSDGSINYINQGIEFTIPKTFIDLEDDFDKTEEIAAFIESDADTFFSSGMFFFGCPFSAARNEFDEGSSDIFDYFNISFLSESTVSGMEETTIAGYHSYTADISGRFNKGFGPLSGRKVTGKAAVILNTEAETIIYTALFQTDSKIYNSIPAFMEMLDKAVPYPLMTTTDI